ncbi:RteC domain-containing protein [Flagellimonas onchidii]|uniref:RteC domain-containing protein n=1 Tax=Flagellimonas onchidii TaxID=2562684 RepID=UPI0010A6460F|nr:RteC domain-containing protein [Allomuricauda onchidii]
MTVFKKILEEFNSSLNSLELEIDDVVLKSEKGIKITKSALKSIRKYANDYQFNDKQEEIDFFKNIKPRIYCKLIYYVKLFTIESKRPRSSNKSQIKYLDSYIEKLQVYFNDNLEFYQYYRRNATSLDEQYFLRGRTDIRLFPDTFHCFTDEEFSTSHDNTVATIMAYDMLIIYLKKEIDKLENYNGMEMAINPYNGSTNLFWTAHKTDLIELIYALHSSGAVNSGTADIKKMAAAYEQMFNIDLGNYYHTFVEIRSRKSNNTKFLDKLKESLLKKYEDSDE